MQTSVTMTARIYNRNDVLLSTVEGQYSMNQFTFTEGGNQFLSIIPMVGIMFAPKVFRLKCVYAECKAEGKHMTAEYHQMGDVFIQIPRHRFSLDNIERIMDDVRHEQAKAMIEELRANQDKQIKDIVTDVFVKKYTEYASSQLLTDEKKAIEESTKQEIKQPEKVEKEKKGRANEK